MTRATNVVTLVVPAVLAAALVTRGHGDDPVVRVAAPVLVGLWVALLGLLALRVRDARTGADGVRPWDVLDVLTGAGRATMWTSLLAVLGALVTGWASLAVIAVLGLGVVYVAASWTLLVGASARPWAGATVTREILPAVSTEGEPVREELRVTGVRIPAGLRLFATGRPTRRGVVTRYAIGAEGAGADLRLESSLGCAPRGDHRAPPLAMWFGDVLGLSRAPIVYRGGTAEFTVLPRTAPVDGVRALLGQGGDDAAARPTEHMPTEGSFRIREYVAGDDTRRIHWVRSLQANELVVRLPDEIPPADPVVRVVLDTHLWGADLLTCQAPDQLFDALVRVWLGVGQALAAAGTRVTLVTTHSTEDGVAPVSRGLVMRGAAIPVESLRLGARTGWQAQVPIEAMLGGRGERHVVVSSRPRAVAAHPDLIWVFVPEAAWTAPEPWLPTSDAIRLPFPIGAADNQLGRRRRERQRVETMWRDRMVFHQMVWWRPPAGAYLASPMNGRVALAVVP